MKRDGRKFSILTARRQRRPQPATGSNHTRKWAGCASRPGFL